MFKSSQNCSESSQERSEVLFFGRKNCDASAKALNHLICLGFKVTSVFSNGRGEALPEDISSWSGDYIFCFRSMFILPKSLINRAKVAAINFHPGSPEYPGSGSLNFALYENSKFYGVTSHLMSEKVDAGSIVECRRFPIHDSDSVNTLLERTHVKLLDLFFDVVSGISIGGHNYIKKSLDTFADDRWSGVNRKIRDLDRLSIIDKNITEDDLKKLIRATFTEGYPPKIVLYGYEFVLKSAKKSQAY